VVRASGSGTTLRLEADGAALLGITVDGSGGRFDLLDAAVRVEADDVRIEGVTVRNALFGLLVEKSNRVQLRNNSVLGDASKPLGMRGDGIRLWEVRDSQIVGNRVRDSRDLVVWYSPGNEFIDNEIERGRYGTHFMYSHDNLVHTSRFNGNVVGIFVMYSRGLELRQNRIAESSGAAGIGLGAKESGNLVVVDNLFVGNAIGVYLDTSPLDRAHRNRFERNAFRFSDTAVVFHGGADRNAFFDNSFRDNQTQVGVEGRGDAMDAEWLHNDFDDYAGYDLDGDGYGDIAYELRSLSNQLIARHPGLAFFRGSAAMSLVSIIGRVAPLFQPHTLLVDPEPRMTPPRGSHES
jgi:nitrous oxidase accessory protein